ncbi:hypothetical protein ZWY2020_005315 [Hordeum vulgare]|nr:hypothetical protein ZWY2020_005315 [Hordeum vulgare]
MEEHDQDHSELSQAELLQATNELMDHTLSFVRSMALGCAVKLGVADAIHRGGGHVFLHDLIAALPNPVTASKLPHLGRLMRVLTTSGVFAQADDGAYCLTPVSSLLVSDGGKRKNQTQLVRLHLSPLVVSPFTNMAEWFTSDDGEDTAFKMTHGADFWGVCERHAEFSKLFNEALASDSQFIMDAAIHGAGRQVFEGINSLVDVGGGTGEAAKAVARAFPHIKCIVLDRPQVIDGIPAGGPVEFVGGDFMDFIPQANALLLKFVLHDWSDKDCVRILRRCREAIPPRQAGGKVIIIEIVVGSSSEAIYHATQQLYDLHMSMVTPGMERDEKEWCKLFMESGFTKYKINPLLGLRSIIEVFP